MNADYIVASLGMVLGGWLIYKGFWKSFHMVNMGIVCSLLGFQIFLSYDYKKIIMILSLIPIGILISKFSIKDPDST